MDRLYHYCSTDTFAAILRTRTIWLSSLSLSNDTMEGRLVNHTIMRLADRDQLDANTREMLGKSISFLEEMFDGLGFSLSENGDLLSQWRGYSDDARGVSIGFERKYLEKLAEASRNPNKAGFALYKVEYETTEHANRIEPTYQELRKLIDAGAFRLQGIRTLLDSRTDEEVAEEDRRIESARKTLYFKQFELFPHLYRLKSPAFKEEQEWRLVSMLFRDSKDECLYRPVRNRIIPYREFELTPNEFPSITEVVLGPRHATPTHVAESMLFKAGFGNVSVRRSEASYR